MSRENTLSPEAINSMNQVIDKIPVLNNRFYYHIDRTDTGCFYLPTPDPNSSVKFRGQCDQNITVMTNFQPQRVSKQATYFEVNYRLISFKCQNTFHNICFYDTLTVPWQMVRYRVVP